MDPLSTENLTRTIVRHGLYHQQDLIVGKKVDELSEKGFPFKTEEGLDFCKLYTFDNERVRSILESVFPWSGLGCYKALGHDSSRVFCFLGSNKPEVRALIVQLWSSKSRVEFYKGSHLQGLKPRPAANGFLEVPLDNLKHDSIEHVQVEMEEGGLTIIDARLGFRIIQGLAINFGFATKEELREWASMKLPDLRPLRDRVMSMSTERIGNNFEFVGK